MASQDDIRDYFGTLRLGAASIAGAGMEDAEREQVRVLADACLNIIEAVVLDVNTIAFCMMEDEQRRRSEK